MSSPEVDSLQAERIVSQVQKLPAVPQILLKLQRMFSDYNTDPNDVVDVIRLDPTLVAKVLQLSNSSFYARASRITSIEEAISVIGFRELFRLVSTALTTQIVAGPLGSYGLEAGELWQHSVLCGVTMEALAFQTVDEMDTAYTIGLLHGIGKLVVHRYLEQTGGPAVISDSWTESTIAEHEVSVVGAHNAEIGGFLLRKWDFPAEVEQPIRFQYDPIECPRYKSPASLLFLAKWINESLRNQPEEPLQPSPYMLEVMDILRLKESYLPDLKEQSAKALEKGAELLRVF